MKLTDAQIDAIAEKVAEKLRPQPVVIDRIIINTPSPYVLPSPIYAPWQVTC